MKKIILILSIIVLASCSSKDDPGDIQNTQFQDIQTILPQGTWSISSYTKGGTDQTINFESFVFTFNEDGSVSAENNLFSESGTWGYDNITSVEEKFNLQFNQTTPFDLISKNWTIVSTNNTEVSLEFTNESSGESEMLTFSKL